MVGEFWCYSLLYWLFALVVIYPPDEVVSAGLTIEALFGSWLGSQTFSFIQYHIRRTAVTFIAHSLLLPVYIVMLFKVIWVDEVLQPQVTVTLTLLSVLPIIIAALMVLYWWRNNWEHHPLSCFLKLYATDNLASPNAWVTVASNVNIEFRRIDKFSTKLNSVCRVIATDSWLMKITLHRVHLLHLRDAVLSLESSINHTLPYGGDLDTQHLNIRVTSLKEGIPSFYIKLTALEYKELERKILNPVVNARHVLVQQSLSDRFLSAFIETVNLNPQVTVSGDVDLCIGCMEVVANVKLIRRCDQLPEGETTPCITCYCRPMWCLSCLSKWFAARQNQDQPETWLSSRAPCPTCRSTFCLLDVCLIS